MSTLTWPTLSRDPASFEWQAVARSLDTMSPLDLTVQAQEFIGMRWGAVIDIQLYTEADANLLKALLVQMRGGANTVAMWNMERPIPQGTAAGTPLVAGGSQTGVTLDTDGWTPGATLLTGDFFAVNGELKMVVAPGTADGSGQMTITFEPPLRASPADNAALTTTRPTCTMALTEPVVRWAPKILGRADRAHSFTIQLLERF